MQLRNLCVFSLSMLSMLSMPAFAGADANLLVNGGFEDMSMSGWTAEQCTPGANAGTTSKKVRTGKSALEISHDANDDTRVFCTISVKPGAMYRFSGWIAVKDIPAKPFGANLCLLRSWENSAGNLTGTSDWQYVECYFKTENNITEVRPCVRLGMFSNATTGTAYFDDLKVEEVASTPSGFWSVADESGSDNISASNAPSSAVAQSSPLIHSISGNAKTVIVILMLLAVLIAANVVLYRVLRSSSKKKA